jgi:very-short-patch-repair endonuclease
VRSPGILDPLKTARAALAAPSVHAARLRQVPTTCSSRPRTMARRVAIGDVAANILDQPLPAEGAPILAKRKSVVRKIDEAKHEEKEERELSRAKRVLKEQGHQTLRVTSDTPATEVDPAHETMLRKTATRGVVSLFNALRAAQKEQQQEGRPKASKRRKTSEAGGEESAAGAAAPRADMSKESFLDILRRGTAPPKATAAGGTTERGAPPAPSYLRDDYMLGRKTSKAKHWDLDVDADLADVEDEADQDSERDFGDDDD